MATLTLTAVFVNLVSTGASVIGQSARGRVESYQYPGEVRTYAGGRQRSITSPGEQGTYTVTLVNLPRTSVETLRTWAGLVVQVRDNKGRRQFGVYHKLDIIEWPVGLDNNWDVTLTLSAVTTTEGV